MDGDMGYRVQTLGNKTASVEKNGSNFKRKEEEMKRADHVFQMLQIQNSKV